ncbi:collagen binding domain-containing protein, partial [Anaerobacillus sp. 1_MG-2023]|uniref:MSCRAMM family protein n=1 Tax=Anaerobacillus sp. 1_MG-2023 TaxID=3062655 RepID=UPI0026E36253
AEDLKPGEYQFVETEPALGYDLNATTIEFVISKGQEETLKVTAYNNLTPGSFILTKVDSEDKGNVLQGAVYDLLTEDGDNIAEGLET